jgi:hypothetical protein
MDGCGMLTLGKGCLELIIVWALLGFGAYPLLKERFTEPAPFWSAIAGGFLVAGAWGLLRNAWQARGQAQLIRNAMQGLWPQDGSASAVIGTAVALEEPLVTPFQKRPCVLYSYELSRTERVKYRGSSGSRTETRRTVYLSGVAMAPWAIRGDAGDIRVLGFAIPDQFPEQKLPVSEHASAIRSFVSATEFQDVGKWDVGVLIRHASGIFREADGTHRDDLRFSEATELLENPQKLTGCDLIEQYIPLNASVCALGRYDMLANGLVNELKHGGLQVLPGDGESSLKTLAQRGRSYLFFAIVLLLLGTAGNLGLLTLRERSLQDKGLSHPEKNAALLAAWEAKDLSAIESALKQGASPDLPDSQEKPLLLSAPSQEFFDVLIRNGASPDELDQVGRPLLLAAIDHRNEALAWMLINAGADVRVPQTGWNRTVLEAAFDRKLDALFAALKDKQAPGVLVTKDQGQELTDEKAELQELLTRYSSCLQDGDRETMKSITDNWPEDYLESVGRRLYADSYPLEWEIESGFRDGSKATLIATGRNSSGSPETYVVTCIRQNDHWQIRRIHWDESLSFTF